MLVAVENIDFVGYCCDGAELRQGKSAVSCAMMRFPAFFSLESQKSFTSHPSVRVVEKKEIAFSVKLEYNKAGGKIFLSRSKAGVKERFYLVLVLERRVASLT